MPRTYVGLRAARTIWREATDQAKYEKALGGVVVGVVGRLIDLVVVLVVGAIAIATAAVIIVSMREGRGVERLQDGRRLDQPVVDRRRHLCGNQPVRRVQSFLGDDAAISSRHRVDGVEDDATIQHGHAVKF